MGYVRTAGMSTAARRRRRRAALVLIALVALLVAIAAYALAYFRGWVPGTEGGDTDQVTATSSTPTLATSEVTVNVYNASGVTGIAGRTSEALASLGFDIDAIADAPVGTETPQVAEIRHGAANQEEAQLLATYITGAELVQDTREINEVDLYIGTDFVELEPAPTGTESPSSTG